VTNPENIQNAIGWIGVGKMGNPMATRLIEAGIHVTICDPVVENRASLVARGASVANTVGELAASSGIIFSMIPNDAVLSDVIYGGTHQPGLISQIRAGSILIEMSTVSPQLSERIATDLAARDVAYLRCPVSGSTALARNGTLTILASGNQRAWETSSALLDLIAARKFYLGPHEEARYMKLVLNTLVGATSAILGEALVLGERGGLTPGQMMDVIVESAAASPLMKYKRDMIAQMDFTPAFSVAQMMKDFTLITEVGRDKQIPMFVANLILQQYMAAANVGYSDQDFFALFGWMRGGGGMDAE
jgi:3-hydroxyisobutyrate dehydrogenase-like beta-hydroxyacid dehydrogenase